MLDKFFDLAKSNVLQFGVVFSETLLRTRGLLEALKGTSSEMERALQFLVVATSLSAAMMAFVLRTGGGDVAMYVFRRVIAAVVWIGGFILLHRAVFSLFGVTVSAARITVFACLMDGVGTMLAGLGIVIMTGLTRVFWPDSTDLLAGMVNGCITFSQPVAPVAQGQFSMLFAYLAVFGSIWLVTTVLIVRFYRYCRDFYAGSLWMFFLAAGLAFLATQVFSYTISSALMLGLSANDALCGK